MRRPFASLAILAVIGLASACSGRAENRDAGPQTSRDFPVGDFSRIEVAGPYTVRVATGSNPSVKVTGPANMLDEMEIDVRGDGLRIRPKSNSSFNRINWSSHGPIVVEVGARALSEAIVAGSGDIAIDKLSGQRFTGKIGGSGSIDLGQLDVADLQIDIGGSGDVTGSGRAGRAEYRIAGSGDIGLGEVASQDLKVAIAGSGGVSAQATGTADVQIMGSGDVTITGGAKCSVQKMGSGEVNCS